MRFLFLLLFYFIVFSVFSQKNYTISGYVEDNENGENIFGVNIYSAEKNAGVISNSYGFYSLSLEEGECVIEFSIIGYENKIYKFNLNKDTIINVSLDVQTVNINEVIVRGEATVVEKTRTSVIDIPVKQIKKMLLS